MYLKLASDQLTILDHDYKKHGDYDFEIPDTKLINELGDYKYKVSGQSLVEMTQEEIDNHPHTISRIQRESMEEARKIKKEEARQYLKDIGKSDITSLTKAKEMLWHLKSLVETE